MKPINMKKLEGNPGHRPINDNLEKKLSKLNKPPKPPKTLDKEAKKEWKRVAKILFEADLIKDLDIVALNAYCQTYSVYCKTQAYVNKGLIVKDKDGNPIGNPSLNTMFRSIKELILIMKEFGMTPTSRGKNAILTQFTTNDKDEMDDFISQGANIVKFKSGRKAKNG